MKLLLIFCFAFLCYWPGLQSQNNQQFKLPEGCSQSDIVPGHAIVKLLPQQRMAIDSPVFKQVAATLKTDTIYQKFPFSLIPKNETTAIGKSLVDLSLIYELEFEPSQPIENAINLLLATGLFEYALPHYLPTPLYTPNDPNVASQYYLNNIRAYQAWDVCKGDSNIVVGITDTGIDFAHPDLVNAVKYNYNDPIDGIDNDNDGYVDNYRGWDMGSWDNNPQYSAIGHGIHVCGISGASTDNTFGMAGTGFNCKILPVKVDNQNGNLVATYESVVYAADHGCKVINCSWGSSFSPGQYGQDIVDYVTFNRGALVIAAAGNSNSLNPFYPASYNYVLSVAATDVNDVKWVNSSYGYNVDISAPGKDIYSTWGGGGFITSSGTSMASPCMAGAAALVSAYYPQLSMLQIAERLRTTADYIDTLAGNTAYASWLGTGRLNMYRALTDSFTPSIRLDSYTFTDSADFTFFPGDTLYINVSVLNYLDTSSANLTAQLECLSQYVELI
ncbi:MAG: serine protease, partial [Bacteroidetes bacterium HGW-Bacteroidetes-6]